MERPALQSLGTIVRRDDFLGARTALSARFRRIGAFARAKLSALLWLRLRRAASLRHNVCPAADIDFPIHRSAVNTFTSFAAGAGRTP
jgi:hypothetical protein